MTEEYCGSIGIPFESELEERLSDIQSSTSTEFFEGEMAKVQELLVRARDVARTDRKMESFISQLVGVVQERQEGEKILIFTEYRATQDYIVKG